MTRRLPRAVVALLRRVVSPRVAADLLADLEEDYRRVRAARSPLVAGAWLAGETSSIVVASARGAVARIGDGAPRLARDARLAVRGLRQAPLATAVAVSTVALGLAGLLVAAGLDRSVLRRPVSAIHGDSLRRVGAVDGAGRVAHHFSFREVERIRDHLGDGARHAVANLQPAVVRVRGADVQTMVEVVDGRFFALTGHPILVGRGLVADDDRPAAPPVAVISDALWRRRYAAAPAVVGQRIEINRSSFTVVGVTAAPGAASALGAGVDVWTPLAHGDGVLSPGWRTDADARWFTVFALPVGSVAALDSQLARAASDLAGRDPERWRDRRLLSGPGTLLGGQQRRAARALVALLAALALLVVGAGAANLAGVLMARAAVTARHTAIHLALGAGPWALARRILLEGAMLGGAAGMLAVVVHRGARSWLSEISLLPTLSLRIDVPLDVGDGIAVVIAAVAAGAAVALMPASGALRAGVQASLSRSAWSAGDPTTSRARRLLVAGQSGVSLILVIGAVLFLRTTAALGTVDLGFPRDGLVALDFDLAPAVAPAEAAVLAREAVDRVAARPGVTGVAMASRAPVDRSLPVVAVGRDRDDRAAGAAALSLVTEGY
ncbi:MAG: ABC transporter permease, partial [Vicinamibacterales bacterium]